MTENVQNALAGAFEKFGATPIGPEIYQVIKTPENFDPDDRAAVETVAKEVVERHPRLFNVETSWSDLDVNSEEYQRRDLAFKEALRKSRPIGRPEFRDLDASRLSEAEFHALERCVGGAMNNWDRGALIRARARQLAEDANLRDGGAA